MVLVLLGIISLLMLFSDSGAVYWLLLLVAMLAWRLESLYRHSEAQTTQLAALAEELELLRELTSRGGQPAPQNGERAPVPAGRADDSAAQLSEAIDPLPPPVAALAVDAPAVASAKLETMATLSLPQEGDAAMPEAPPVQEAISQLPASEAARAEPSGDRTQSGDDWWPELQGQVRHYLLGGNIILRVGAVLLFLGLAFLLRYATQGWEMPIWARYCAVGASAMVLSAVGWRQRERRRTVALTLQGAGAATLYLTIFAAFHLHPLLSAPLAFLLMVLLTVASTLLAVKQDSLVMAVAASLGGFAAPILLSTGSGNHIVLFSYYLLLNSGIFAIAWFKAWKPLNLVGFVATFGIGLGWGMRSYRPELYLSCQLFLLAFWLLYIAIGYLFARRKLAEQPPVWSAEMPWPVLHGMHGYLDATLMFGPPLVAFGMQAKLAARWEYGVAWSALACGASYLLLAWLVWRQRRPQWFLLQETYLALGLIFTGLAVPLAFSAEWTAMSWALEAAGILWLGVRQRHLLSRCFALLQLAGATLAFLLAQSGSSDSLLPGQPLGALVLGGALLFACYTMQQAQPGVLRSWEGNVLPTLAFTGTTAWLLLPALLWAAAPAVLAWAVLTAAANLLAVRYRVGAVAGAALAMWGMAILVLGAHWPLDCWQPLALALAGGVGAWCYQQLWPQHLLYGQASRAMLILAMALYLLAGWQWGLDYVSADWQLSAWLLLTAASASLLAWLARRLSWQELGMLPLLQPILGFCLLPQLLLIGDGGLWIDTHDWFGWLLLLSSHGVVLRLLAAQWLPQVRKGMHAAGALLAFVLLTLHVRQWLLAVSGDAAAWQWISWPLVALLYLWWLARRTILPPILRDEPVVYQQWLASLAGMGVLGWMLLAMLFSNGSVTPLPYLPLLNPLELVFVATLFLLSRSQPAALPIKLPAPWPHPLAMLAFVACSTAIFRLAHHWLGIPFDFEALWRSMAVQAGLSLLWGGIALPLMLQGSRRRDRYRWLLGAALFALVVLKLFLVELADRNGLARVISFVGVGVLMLLVGYFAPLPAAREGAAHQASGGE